MIVALYFAGPVPGFAGVGFMAYRKNSILRLVPDRSSVER